LSSQEETIFGDFLENLAKAKRILGVNKNAANVVAVNGCCYGRENQEDKGDYLKVCGQSFWTLITGQTFFYTDIIEPLGHLAQERNDEFEKQFSNVVNLFTASFIQQFCSKNGAIDWVKLVQFNSAKAVKK
jgi:hypothetical protein